MNVMELLFWGLIILVIYAYLGYGILLWVLVKIKRLLKGKKKEFHYDEWPSVALIVPCFNEDAYIQRKIDNSLALEYPGKHFERIFISDGSDDETAAIVAANTGNGIIAMHEDQRRGKAAAMNRAVANTTAEILVFCDANTDLNKEAITMLVKQFANPKIGAVAGVKTILSTGEDGASGAGEGIYWKYESALKRLDSEFYSVVGAARELMAYRKSLYEELPADTLLDDFMQSMRVTEKGYRTAYEPNAIAAEYASANVAEELKRKIRIAAGGWQSMFRLKKAGNPFYNPILWFQYVSHRVLRWSLAAFALLALIPVNIYLAYSVGGIYTLLLLGQALFYILALVGNHFENKNIRVKALYVPYYFSIMNYAVFAGLNRFRKGSQSSLWERAKRAG
jgi:cellulose synthase/poly-beta-1,6-N-acetylglucosamine synthase-like glycosyltransferase